MFQEKYKIEFPDVDFMAKAKVDVLNNRYTFKSPFTLMTN